MEKAILIVLVNYAESAVETLKAERIWYILLILLMVSGTDTSLGSFCRRPESRSFRLSQ